MSSTSNAGIIHTFDSSTCTTQNKGFRPVDPSVPLGPVTAKCSKTHEVGKYSEWDPMLIAVDHITNTCDKFPYHFVFGAVNDIV